MKKLSRTITACLLALLLAVLSPLSVFAQSTQNTEHTGKYISEIKIGMGKDAVSAAAALRGYTILSDNGVNVDLNQEAGGGFASKGEKIIYLGYKTTDDPSDAITDIAVMNMKGGYSVLDYTVTFDTYIKSQIEPLVERLTAAVKEYRYNFSSDNESNRKRAQYIYNALNKLVDDDTGKGLGTLLLNPTRYEMGDEAYKALSEEQKKNTADIVTILAQANGRATLLFENLIARAADTSGDTWLDRFAATTYDDLLEELCEYEGMFPSEAKYELVRRYEGDATKIRAMWSQFRAVLAGRDEAQEIIDNYDAEAVEQEIARLDEIIDELSRITDPSEEQREALEKAFEDRQNAQAKIAEAVNALRTIAVYSYLDEIEYGDGTLAGFFSRTINEVDLTELYPIAASLSDGQRVGLDFLSLLEMVTIAMTDGDSYSDQELDLLSPASIYEGVDRGIYEPGGVALTSQALRERALEKDTGVQSLEFSGLTTASIFLGCASIFLFAASYYHAKIPTSVEQITSQLSRQRDKIVKKLESVSTLELKDGELVRVVRPGNPYNKKMYEKCMYEIGEIDEKIEDPTFGNEIQSPACKYLSIGICVATAVIMAWSLYMTYQELKDYYNVEFTPIPLYMVDEKDITAYNAKGEKIFIKNQTAYYKAAECNRTESDENYGTLGTCADFNGDVGAQWLAPYTVKQEAAAPILAGSLKAVIKNDELPAGYTTGIHMFGSNAAFNLNSTMYDWSRWPPSVYVYYKTDDDAKRSAMGSIFAGGQMAFAASLGAVLGILASLAAGYAFRRKKKETDYDAA